MLSKTILISLSIVYIGCSASLKGLHPFDQSGFDGDSSLVLQGYYYYSDDSRVGSVVHAIVFWEDGTAVVLPGIGRGIEFQSPRTLPTVYGTLDQALEDAGNYIVNLSGGKDDVAAWGTYRVRGDSLAILVTRRMETRLGGFDIVEYEGFILSDTSFVITTPYLPTNARTIRPRNWIYNFHPLDQKPDSANWTHRGRLRR